MKKKSKAARIIPIILIVIAAAAVIFFAVRAVGIAINKKVPDGGINEAMFVDVNGTKQWISIYGQDINNPVLLYLHGGPGAATSDFDYVVTRKWSDVFTVVTWDQRNCGKSYDKSQNDIALTKEMFLEDGKELTEFLLKHLDKEKITVLGHSWGSALGANLALEYPQYYECFIGTGQLIDSTENERALAEEAKNWVGDDAESLELLSMLDPDNMSMEHITARNKLMEKYGYGVMAGGADYNLASAVIFNPYYSIGDWINYFRRDMSVYFDFFVSEDFRAFSIKDRKDFAVPYININGNKDYQTNYKLAQEFFDEVNAPYKKMYIMDNMTHGLLESRSEEFSSIVHEIAAERGEYIANTNR